MFRSRRPQRIRGAPDQARAASAPCWWPSTSSDSTSGTFARAASRTDALPSNGSLQVSTAMFSESISAEGALVFAKAVELGLEGIVSKRSGSLYRSGTSKSRLKPRTRRLSGRD